MVNTRFTLVTERGSDNGTWIVQEELANDEER